ncbi:MAG: hypothetical protein KC636_13005, partial [Myxococcales bacterium]|nr:hypothetical protein [Myxococcales bacterium]
ELFNRIDHVIQFGPLSREAAYSIARRELKRLLDRHGLTERNVFVRFTPAVVDMIVREGFHARDGARSLKRFLEDRVGARLAEDIAGAGVAAVRVFWLYMRDGALMVHGEHLVEAEARGIDPRIEDLVEWNMGRLRLEIPRALAEADALLVSDASARLASALSESLDKFRARADQEQGRVVYTLETLRGELQALRERLATQLEYDPALSHAMELEDRVEAEAEIIEATAFPRWPKVIPRRDWDGEVIFLRGMDLRQIGPALPMKTRPAIIEHVASLLFLERALARAEDPDEHVVILELSRISRSRGANRFAADEPGLLEWLAEAYAQHGQGEVDERAVAELAGDDATVSRYQPERYHRAFEQVTLRIIGPSVRTFFRGEHGCHVRHSVSGTSEVVRVRVLPGRERSAEAHLRGIAEARRAFEEWLEGGSDGRAPDNPDEILPILRRYHFDLPSAGVQAPIVVEDYVLAHATETRVRQLGDALPTLWILRLGAERGAEEG